MAQVVCGSCGGPHPSWECPRRWQDDEPEPREPDTSWRGTAGGQSEFARLSKAEQRKVPWQQPLGTCISCDKRRAYNARRMGRKREDGEA